MAMGKSTTIEIPAPNIKILNVKVNGATPLMYNRWSNKAKTAMRNKQTKQATSGREVRKPLEDYYQSFYLDSEGYLAFPALSFKQSLVSAARSLDDLHMTQLRAWLFAVGDEDGMVRIKVNGKPVKPSKSPKLTNGENGEAVYAVDKNPNVYCREDLVRLKSNSADLRYRGTVKKWSAELILRYNANKLSAAQVLNLLQLSGFSVGIGEWRPERGGDMGTFKIEQS